MRRTAAVLLVGLGAFLLVFAALAKFYAYPRLAVAPIDQDSMVSSAGSDVTVFDISILAERETDVLSTRFVVGDVEASQEADDGVAVWDTSVRTTDADGDLLSATLERAAFDQRSGLAVNCCGEHYNEVPVDHEGLVFKFPFNTQQEDYEFWDASVGEARTAVFSGVEEIDGVTVYRFVQTIEPTQIAEQDVPPSLVGESGEDAITADRYYSNTRTLWVEPETGAILRGQEDQLSTLRVDGEDRLTLTDGIVGYTDEQVADNVETFASLSTQLSILRVWAPLVTLVLGLLALAGGAVLLLGLRRQDEAGHRRGAGDQTEELSFLQGR